ncbi:MAG TPA: dodecin [Tepidisphaeraceae bacterium]|jgi:flavin-binding protein dodecin|nr:dodecin [Tepidisphaeraceae bacterium]
MNDHVFKLIELTGTSTTTLEDAIQNALSRAAETLREMRWFQVTETRGAIKDGKVSQWQVTIKVGFRLEEPA